MNAMAKASAGKRDTGHAVSTVGNGPPDYLIPLTISPGAPTVDVEYPPRGQLDS